MIIEMIYKSKGSNIAGDRVYKGCVLLTEGIYTDSFSKRTMFYDGRVISKNAKNWQSNYLTIDHSKSIMDRIGYIENPRWDGKSLLADLRIMPITQRAIDLISLIDNKMASGFSIEAETKEVYDSKRKMLMLSEIQFLGGSIVTSPACEDAGIST